jgi:hypothetical protein
VNHTEPELFLQRVNEVKVRVREANGRRLEFLILHEFYIFAHGQVGLSLPKSSEEAER